MHDGNDGYIYNFATEAATQLLRLAHLNGRCPIVALDQIEYQTEAARKKKTSTEIPEVKRAARGDEQLFKATYGAIRAAVFWRNSDGRETPGRLSFNIPVCVFSRPFWNVRIDGVEQEPELSESGYQVFLLPEGELFVRPLVLHCSIAAFESLVAAADGLFEWFDERIADGEHEWLRTRILGQRPPK
jgi:hypothetical protein